MKESIKNQNKINFRIYLLRICFLLPLTLVISNLPSWAGLGNVWIEFQSYSNDFKNYLNNQATEMFNQMQTVNTTVNNASGELRIPNPNTTRKDVINQLSQYPIPDKYENNSVVHGSKISNNLDREITRGAIDATLGSGGQARIKNTLQNAQNSVQQVNIALETASTNKQRKQLEIQAAANTLTGLNIDNLNPVTSAFSSMLNNQAKLTQLTWEGLADLEIQNLNIQNEQTRILAANLGTNIQIQQDLQYSHLNLTNISTELEDINRDRRIETATTAARLLRVATQSNLFQTEQGSKKE
ncbi:hypothetical protein IQ247_21985 [Plectonema cf. radiosum LEGE 06105]|uniref:Uncharacterized protein n=1 Tax=Plectonema cf. radiosum LEGE 06105 TaxID=945769 RepID=A0A8J7F681_9CYAN|nr:hypothetical protein [Plectonema radiosum]MBE9215298.1 hypothetical protein [Plectonema cf. radiosum LEGE 06105]